MSNNESSRAYAPLPRILNVDAEKTSVLSTGTGNKGFEVYKRNTITIAIDRPLCVPVIASHRHIRLPVRNREAVGVRV